MVAPSGECLRIKGRYGLCGCQVKLWSPCYHGPYLSASEMRFMTKRYTNRRSLLTLPMLQPVLSLVLLLQQCCCVVFIVWWSVDSPSTTRQALELAGMYRLCKKLDDDGLRVGVARSKPVKKSRKDRRKVSVVSTCRTVLTCWGALGLPRWWVGISWVVAIRDVTKPRKIRIRRMQIS